MAIHIAKIQLMPVDENGNVLTGNYTIDQRLRSTTLPRIIEDTTNIPNSAGNPSIEDYLVAEDADNFILKHLDQTQVITQDA